MTIHSIAIQAAVFIVLSAARWALNHAFNWLATAVAKVTASERFNAFRNKDFRYFISEILIFAAIIVWIEVHFTGTSAATLNDLRYMFIAIIWLFAIGSLAVLDYATWRTEGLREKVAKVGDRLDHLQTRGDGR